MRTVLLLLSIVLLLGWIGGVLIYALGGLLHILLVMAIVTFVLSRRKRKKAALNELEKSRHREG